MCESILGINTPEVVCFIFNWQQLLGSFLGAIVPLLVWWVIEKNTNFKKYNNYLDLVQKSLGDQVAVVIEYKANLEAFLERLENQVIPLVGTRGVDEYALDIAHFPLIKIRPMSEELHKHESDSRYLEQKILRLYSLSHNFAGMAEDLPHQYKEMVNFNKEIALSKIIPPRYQQEQYVENLREFISSSRTQIIDHNLPIIVRSLAEAIVVVNKRASLGYLKWQLRYGLKVRLYCTKKQYLAAAAGFMEQMDETLKCEFDKMFNEINAGVDKFLTEIKKKSYKLTSFSSHSQME